MRKIATWAVDAHPLYSDACVLSVHSFLRHNAGWEVRIYEVGETPLYRNRFPAHVEFFRADPAPTTRTLTHFPTSWVRCQMLADLPSPDTLMLYTDCDTVYLSSVDKVVEEFIYSNTAIAILPEDDRRGFSSPIVTGWGFKQIPTYFKRKKEFSGLPTLNTGMVLAYRDNVLGKAAVAAYDELISQAYHAEQAIVCSMIYELNLPWFKLKPCHHCLFRESELTYPGKKYIDSFEIDGDPVVMRHFCSSLMKPYYEEILPSLLEHYCP